MMFSLNILGLPHVLPLTVHLDLEHLPDTQGYSMYSHGGARVYVV